MIVLFEMHTDKQMKEWMKQNKDKNSYPCKYEQQFTEFHPLKFTQTLPWRDTETGATAISLSEDHGIYTCSNAAIGTQTRRWSCRSSPRRHHHRTSPVITPAQDAALAFDMDSQQTGIWRRAALSLQRLRGDSWPRFKPRRRARVCAWLPSVADGLL